MYLTSKDKKEIRRTVKLLTQDLRILTSDYLEEEIKVFAFREKIKNYGDKWYLIITRKTIEILAHETNNYSILADRKKYLCEADYIAQFYFIKYYDGIRKNIEEIVNERKKEVGDNIKTLNETRNKYLKKLKEKKKEKKAIVEIELPPTNNRKTIEVIEENGKKVGTITFEGAILKIITDANIEFKSKSENEKIKRK